MTEIEKIVFKMLKKNIDIDTIAEITGLSIEQIETLNYKDSENKPFITFRVNPIYNFEKYRFCLYDESTKKYPYLVELSKPYYEVAKDSLDLNTTYTWKFQGKSGDSTTWDTITPSINLEKPNLSENKYHQLEWEELDELDDDGASKIYRVLIFDRLQSKIIATSVVIGNKYMLDISNMNTELIAYRVQNWDWKSTSWLDNEYGYSPIIVIKNRSLFKKISENKDIPMDLELFNALNIEYENKRYIFDKSKFIDKKNLEKNKEGNNLNTSQADNTKKWNKQ